MLDSPNPCNVEGVYHHEGHEATTLTLLTRSNPRSFSARDETPRTGGGGYRPSSRTKMSTFVMKVFHTCVGFERASSSNCRASTHMA